MIFLLWVSFSRISFSRIYFSEFHFCELYEFPWSYFSLTHIHFLSVYALQPNSHYNPWKSLPNNFATCRTASASLVAVKNWRWKPFPYNMYVALCHTFPHCETSLCVLRTQETNFSPNQQKILQKPGKTGQKPAKTGEILGVLIISLEDSETLGIFQILDYSGKDPAEFRPIPNLRPFLDFGWNVLPIYYEEVA